MPLSLCIIRSDCSPGWPVRKRRLCCKSRCSSGAVSQNPRGLFPWQYPYGWFLSTDYTWDMPTIVFSLLPHSLGDDLLGIHQLFDFDQGDLLIRAVSNIPDTYRHKQKGQQQGYPLFYLSFSKSPAAKTLCPCAVKWTPS